MMGTKARHFAPLVNVSLEELVPQDHFYRHLEQSLDLSFVREFVRQTYAGGAPTPTLSVKNASKPTQPPATPVRSSRIAP